MLTLQTWTKYAYNNRGELIYQQVHVTNQSLIYEGWGWSVFEADGIIYGLNNNGKLYRLSDELSEELSKTEWAYFDGETGDDGEPLSEFPLDIFSEKGQLVPSDQFARIEEQQEE